MPLIISDIKMFEKGFISIFLWSHQENMIHVGDVEEGEGVELRRKDALRAKFI